MFGLFRRKPLDPIVQECVHSLCDEHHRWKREARSGATRRIDTISFYSTYTRDDGLWVSHRVFASVYGSSDDIGIFKSMGYFTPKKRDKRAMLEAVRTWDKAETARFKDEISHQLTGRRAYSGPPGNQSTETER